MSEAAIDLHACVHNCRVLRERAGARKLFAVVKANAYGHGMIPVAEALSSEADGFCVFAPAEAVRLAQSGIGKPIFAMGGFADDAELEALDAARVWIAVHAVQQARMLAASACSFERAFVKVNTGMNRLGIAPQDAEEAVGLVSQAAGEVGLMTHFACGDTSAGTADQAQRIAELSSQLQLPVTCCSTAATHLDPPPVAGEEFVRCGIGIYGAAAADEQPSELGLRPAMTLRAPVLGVQELKPGDSVGYGLTWRASEPTAIAIVGIGYADGYPRLAAGAPALIGERKCRLVGRVSMDMAAFETGLPACRLGESAELWGNRIPVDEVARCADTIGYRLLAGLAERVRRTYF